MSSNNNNNNNNNNKINKTFVYNIYLYNVNSKLNIVTEDAYIEDKELSKPLQTLTDSLVDYYLKEDLTFYNGKYYLKPDRFLLAKYTNITKFGNVVLNMNYTNICKI